MARRDLDYERKGLLAFLHSAGGRADMVSLRVGHCYLLALQFAARHVSPCVVSFLSPSPFPLSVVFFVWRCLSFDGGFFLFLSGV